MPWGLWVYIGWSGYRREKWAWGSGRKNEGEKWRFVTGYTRMGNTIYWNVERWKVVVVIDLYIVVVEPVTVAYLFLLESSLLFAKSLVF
jgi:hypothetical protein